MVLKQYFLCFVSILWQSLTRYQRGAILAKLLQKWVCFRIVCSEIISCTETNVVVKNEKHQREILGVITLYGVCYFLQYFIQTCGCKGYHLQTQTFCGISAVARRIFGVNDIMSFFIMICIHWLCIYVKVMCPCKESRVCTFCWLELAFLIHIAMYVANYKLK